MKKSIIFIILLFIIFTANVTAQNVVVVIIDGARYSETFGDPARTYIPKMDILAEYGTYIDEFYNDSRLATRYWW